MKVGLLSITLVSSLAIFSQVAFAGKGTQARAPKKGGVFTFYQKKHECKNGRGVQGYNLVGNSECSDYTERSLSGVEAAGLKLMGSTFEGRTLKRLEFRNTNLAFTNLRGTHINSTTFHDVILTGADLRGAKVYHSLFSGNTKLAGAIVDETTKIKGLIVEKDGATLHHDKDVLNFALSNDMIYMAAAKKEGATQEIFGGTIQKAKWDSERKSGFAVLNLNGQTKLLFIDKEVVADKAAAFKGPGKVVVGIREAENGKTYLVYTETLIVD